MVQKNGILPRLVWCHRITDRCFTYRGKPMPICARCLGVLFGQVIAIAALLLFRLPSWPLAVALMVPMAADWSLQRYLSLLSNNPRRFITGILGGLGLTSLQLQLVIAIGTWACLP